MKRTSEEYVLLSFSLGGALAIFPYAVIRVIQGEWLIALLDAVLVLGMLLLGGYVYKTQKTKFASLALTLLALTGMTLVVILKGPSVIYWAYPTMLGVYFILPPRQAVLLTFLSYLLLVPVIISNMPPVSYALVLISLMVNNIFAYIFSSRMYKQYAQLSLLVREDPLTGTGNRRALNEKLDEWAVIFKRTQQLACLIVLDVDHFKQVNDSYGHTVGDQVLIKIATQIKARIRETDYLYRYGGEEFVLVVANTGLLSAKRIAEELRVIIESTSFVDDQKITISLGVAEIILDELADSWLNRGDKAMYEAKETGRNKVCIAS